MDGNGRWARQRGLKRTEGHAAGEEALFDTVEGALELGIQWFTVYAFSTENWRRPADEVRFLMGFNKGILERHAEDLHERNVRIRFVGRRDWRVPQRRAPPHGVGRPSSPSATPGMTLTIAFNYGGRAEIVDAVQAIVRRRASTPDKIDEKTIRRHLYAPTCPTPTSWSARRASTASPTSCCGSWPTASSSSPTCCGPTSAASTSSTPIREYQARDRRFGGLADRGLRPSCCTATRASSCGPTSSARPTASSC